VGWYRGRGQGHTSGKTSSNIFASVDPTTSPSIIVLLMDSNRVFFKDKIESKLRRVRIAVAMVKNMF
jgi:hypothetical protein